MLFVHYCLRSTKRDILLSHICLVPLFACTQKNLLAIPPLLNVGGTHDRFTVSLFLLFAITPLVPGLLLITSEFPLFIRSYLSLLLV